MPSCVVSDKLSEICKSMVIALRGCGKHEVRSGKLLLATLQIVTGIKNICEHILMLIGDICASPHIII